jgi:hypothetical protein
LLDALGEHPDIIYIGAHTVPYRGGRAIELGLNASGRPDLLTSADIRRLRVPGAIVTMAACGSAADSAADGGLMSAWLAAGARAVIGTRSRMPDVRGEFPAAVYAHLWDDSGPGAVIRALRSASLDLSRAGARTWWSNYVAAVRE